VAESTYAGRPGGVRISPDVVSIDICDHILEQWLAVQLLRVDQNKERLFFLFYDLGAKDDTRQWNFECRGN